MTERNLRFLLDTSVYSQPIRRVPRSEIVHRWKAEGDRSLAVSIFCEMEVLQGMEMSSSVHIRRRFERILSGRLTILPFTLEEARIYARLQASAVRTGRTRPVLDLLIAATALSNGLILATLNARDFEGIPGLSVEVWGCAQTTA